MRSKWPTWTQKAHFEAGKCQTPALYLIRLNDWEESVSNTNMDQAGPLPHNTARMDSVSGCRVRGLQPRLVAKMAKKRLCQRRCVPLGNTASPGRALIIKQVSIQVPTNTYSPITMYSFHGNDWSSQSYGLKLKNSAHCSHTSESLGTNTGSVALLVTSCGRGSGRLHIHATMVDQLNSVRELQPMTSGQASILASRP